MSKKIAALQPDRPTLSTEVEWQEPRGETYWQLWTVQGIYDKQRQLVEIQSVGHNITDRKLVEIAATQYARELSALQAATTILLSTLDLERLLGEILDAATSAIPAAEKGMLHLIAPDTGQLEMRAVLGYTETDSRIKKFALPGKVSYITETVRSQTPLLVDDTSADQVAGQPEENREQEMIRSVITAPLLLEDRVLGALALESSRPAAFTQSDLRLLVNYASTATATIHNAQLHSEVQKMAITDSLTGLFNRRGVFELGEREVERALRFGRPLAAILLDVDYLKQVNDARGHPAGDQVLRFVAEQIRSNTRKVDISGRYGGDEFVLLLPENDLFGAVVVAERLRDSVAQTPVQANNASIFVTISLGVVKVTPDIQDLQALLQRADHALYAAKQAGRNRLEIR